ncbi:MAG: hypothetical protein HOH43_13470 [Candidatus Latescibacteria bacterium]|jgi:hypothetical protein|nr:hypothetical protein [Candidatus Latescibacterota bacterium]
MIYFLIGLSLVALVVSFLAWRRSNKLQVELVKLRSLVFDLSRGVREIREELKESRRQVHLMMQHGGKVMQIEATTQVRDAMAMHPGIRDVFASIHMRSGSKSAIGDEDTIAQVAAGHEKDINLLLGVLNEVLEKSPDEPVVQNSDDTGLIQISPMPESD